MEEAKAKLVLFVAMSSTARCVSEIFGTLEGNQLEGQDLIAEACHAMNVTVEEFYDMQHRCLEKQRELREVLSEYTNQEFFEVLGCDAPTWRMVSDSVGEAP